MGFGEGIQGWKGTGGLCGGNGSRLGSRSLRSSSVHMEDTLIWPKEGEDRGIEAREGVLSAREDCFDCRTFTYIPQIEQFSFNH